MTQMTIEQYQEQFKQHSDDQSAWLNQLRQQAMHDFSENGFESLKQENWKYTNIKPILSNHFNFNSAKETIHSTELPDFSAYQIIFINGKLQTNLLSIPAEISIEKLSNIESQVEEYFVDFSKKHNQAFTQLNTAFCSEAVVIQIRKNTTLANPLHILHLTTSDNLQIHQRHLILLEENSVANLIEHFVGSQDKEINYFNNVVTDIVIQQNAKLNYHKIIEENSSAFHIGLTQVTQKKQSYFKNFALAFNGQLIRNDLHINFLEEHAECELNGLYITNKKQQVDHYTQVDHRIPHCISRQNYKGIANDHSRAIFCGKVIVHSDAHKSCAYQSNKNLLLATTAEIATKPQLEIFNDDVKCTHGATIGQLDEQALFYLRSRGLSQKVAVDLLIAAFADELLEKIELLPLKKYLQSHLINKLGAES